jgi:hypothetical protein
MNQTLLSFAGKPIRIAVMTTHYFGSYGERVGNCPAAPTDNPVKSATLLDCEIVEGNQTVERMADKADALWYHIPSLTDPGIVRRRKPHQLLVGISAESPVNYRLVGDPVFMNCLDIRMTYHLHSADIITHYFDNRTGFYGPPAVPIRQKIDAVVFINSNCEPPSGRDSIVRRLMQSGIRVDAYGPCLHNMQNKTQAANAGKRLDKLAVFRRYRYCVCIENSVDEDYVTEKLWDGLGAGCLPIYYGAPNVVRDFLPSPQAALLYDPAKPDELAETIKRLSSDNSLYEERMRWRSEPIERLAAGFRRLLDLTRLPPTKCQLCQLVARKRRSSPSSSAVCGTQQPT